MKISAAIREYLIEIEVRKYTPKTIRGYRNSLNLFIDGRRGIYTEKKTVSERYGDEILTDNAALNHYSQCRDCMFRDKRLIGGEEYGYDKSVCRIYGKASAERTNKASPDFFPYTPIEPGDKPSDIYNNAADCAYYEQEK